MQQFTISNTGFVYPDYEIVIECEENRNDFNIEFTDFSTDEDEHFVKRNKIIASIIHTKPFIEMLSDEKFITELHSSLCNPKFYEPSKEFDFSISIIKSVNV